MADRLDLAMVWGARKGDKESTTKETKREGKSGRQKREPS